MAGGHFSVVVTGPVDVLCTKQLLLHERVIVQLLLFTARDIKDGPVAPD